MAILTFVAIASIGWITTRLLFREIHRKYQSKPISAFTVACAFSLTWFFALLALAACTPTIEPTMQATATPAETPIPTPTPDIGVHFPQQRKINGEWAAMDASARGELVLDNNCIRLGRGESLLNYLLIWPPDFTISRVDGEIQITNEDGSVVAAIGDRVEMGGGEIHSKRMLDEYIKEQIPPECPGSFWVMGYEFEVVNP